ncbi:MAG: formylglycine-generating enzyme family protein [bacterium]|nr:formylglycine-generating enzyme family protein [bacterium]
MSGDTWHFQVWYRDTAVTSSNSNFSNGLSVTFGNGPQPSMVSIPAGTFSMGSNAASGAPYYGGPVTQPVYNATIGQDFWMGEYEVTQVEYSALMGSNPSGYSGANLPVEKVTWNDAVAYCIALTAQEMALGNMPAGYEYRLPTEAEWEYACRAGTTTEYNVGAELYCADARTYHSMHSGGPYGIIGTIDVGNYSANAFGLYDMHGNVVEWCLDTYSSYSAGAVTDPFVTGGSNRVLRSAWRRNQSPSYSANHIGFRVALAPILAP